MSQQLASLWQEKKQSGTAEQTEKESRLGDNTNIQGKDYFQSESKIEA